MLLILQANQSVDVSVHFIEQKEFDHLTESLNLKVEGDKPKHAELKIDKVIITLYRKE